MPRLTELADVLVACRVVTHTQWDRAIRIGGDRLDRVLDALTATRPEWWDGEPPTPPGLTDYQRAAIETRFTADELDHLRPELALNQFLLLEKLGQGGQGAVYRGRQLSPPRYAAVKTLIRDTEVARRRFEREARTLMKLRHPAVARFHLYERVRDAEGHPTDEYLIAMELVDGTDLGRLVRRVRSVPWAFAARWALDLLGGLAAIHELGFVHQDVKPENVMILGPDPGPGGRPEATAAKLLDFGAVRSMALGDVAGAGRVFVGTPEYASPEQWSAAVVPASDLYALGGTLYYVFTGRCPYQKDRRDANAYRRSHLRDDVPDPREFNPDVPPAVAELVQRMMAKNPAERGTATEMGEEFRHLLKRAGVSSSQRLPGLADRKPNPPDRRPAASPPLPAAGGRGVGSPVRPSGGSLLSFLERMFIPGHIPPRPGEEPAVFERILALLRRPTILLILAVVLSLVIWWMW